LSSDVEVAALQPLWHGPTGQVRDQLRRGVTVRVTPSKGCHRAWCESAVSSPRADDRAPKNSLIA